ncbi:MAG: ABC transporter permease subunit, partial [Phycisphaerae bacterium]|nr:ABC transporter permease subunit [Phycisphaerae bacterium]
LGALFALIPFLVVWFLDQFLRIQEQVWLPFFLVSNPYAMMAFATQWLMSPSAMMAGMVTYWPVHCAILLAGSGLLLFWCTVRVRKVALRQIAGDTGSLKKGKAKPVMSVRQFWRLRHMGNWPVLWKDLRIPVLGGKTRFRKNLQRVAVVGVLALIYTAIGVEGDFGNRGMHASMSCMYTILAALVTIVITATPITSEKEARSWPILLGTAQTDWQILVSKALAMLRWSLPVWGLLFGHLFIFCLCGIVHPVVLVLEVPVALGVINLILGLGLYWSARLRRTTTAVVCNFMVPLVIWLVLPIMFAILSEINRQSNHSMMNTCINWNPFIQAGNIAYGCARNSFPYQFDWEGGKKDLWDSLWLVLKVSCVYSAIGFGFAIRALSLFRRRIF